MLSEQRQHYAACLVSAAVQLLPSFLTEVRGSLLRGLLLAATRLPSSVSAELRRRSFLADYSVWTLAVGGLCTLPEERYLTDGRRSSWLMLLVGSVAISLTFVGALPQLPSRLPGGAGAAPTVLAASSLLHTFTISAYTTAGGAS